MCCCGACDSIVSLKPFGLTGTGCIRDSVWLASIKVPCNQSLLVPVQYIDTPERKLCHIKTAATGKFGAIEIANRTDASGISTAVFVKKPRIAGKSLLYEALLQNKVQMSLAEGGFPTGAPRVLDIFRLHDGSVCFTMELIEGTDTLDAVLSTTTGQEFTNILIECLLQVCAMIWHLETSIGMNHRDLKPSNLLLRRHAPVSRKLRIADMELTIESNFTIILIDFGFSCIGTAETQKADIALGTHVYHPADPCPKKGRDLYSFLAFIFAGNWRRMSADMVGLFEKWLTIPGSKLTEFLRKSPGDVNKWIYFITGNKDINEFDCCPCRIVGDLRKFGGGGGGGAANGGTGSS